MSGQKTDPMVASVRKMQMLPLVLLQQMIAFHKMTAGFHSLQGWTGLVVAQQSPGSPQDTSVTAENHSQGIHCLHCPDKLTTLPALDAAAEA